MNKNNILGIDLAKNIFHLCLMSKTGRVLKRFRVNRSNLMECVTKHNDGIVAFEACGGANYWARRFESEGLEVRQIPAQFVKPFVKSNKNDEIDAEAICEAASRPQMRFISTKSSEQQDVQNLHRIRERLVRQRTAISNEIRGFLTEYGIIIPKGLSHVRNKLHAIIDKHSSEQSHIWKETFLSLYEEFSSVDDLVEDYDKRLKVISKENEVCKRLMKVDGVGVLTATAIVASVSNPKEFKNGRQFAAYLGLTPRQHSTGGKQSLGRISKRGDKYLRKLLVQGARSCAIAAEGRRNSEDPTKRKLNQTQKWFFDVAGRRGANRAIVALANKTARRILIVLNGEDFKQPEELLAQVA